MKFNNYNSYRVEIQQLQANLEHLSNKLEKTPQFAKDLPQTGNLFR